MPLQAAGLLACPLVPIRSTSILYVSACQQRGRPHAAYYYWRVADENLPVWQQYRGTNK